MGCSTAASGSGARLALRLERQRLEAKAEAKAKAKPSRSQAKPSQAEAEAKASARQAEGRTKKAMPEAGGGRANTGHSIVATQRRGERTPRLHVAAMRRRLHPRGVNARTSGLAVLQYLRMGSVPEHFALGVSAQEGLNNCRHPRVIQRTHVRSGGDPASSSL